MSVPVLIVNADDFGRSPAVNEGVMRCHEDGIVTSATLMVRWPDADAAAAYARRTPSLGLGLHVDLGEWFVRDGEWHARYEVLAEETREAVREELARQLDRFERLVGRPPDHLDSHQHVHRSPPARPEILGAARRLGVPVRGERGFRYDGGFFGQGHLAEPLPELVTVDALVEKIESLPEGITELGCHPATAVDHESAYAEERVVEATTLRDPRVRAAVARRGARLARFSDAPVVLTES